MKKNQRSKAASRMRITMIGSFLLMIMMLLNQVFFTEKTWFDPVSAKTESDGFDYYVLALSWSPAYCAKKPEAEQCGFGRGFILHGLWPQYEQGFPQYCETDYRMPSRALLRNYIDLNQSSGLLKHQWRKHGVCAEVSPKEYFELSKQAVKNISIPPQFERHLKTADFSPKAIEAAFITANPQFNKDSITIKCRDNRLSEIRICLTKDLEPRLCGKDIRRDCRAREITLIAPK